MVLRHGETCIDLWYSANRTELTARMRGCETGGGGGGAKASCMSTEQGRPIIFSYSVPFVGSVLFPFPKTPHSLINFAASLAK